MIEGNDQTTYTQNNWLLVKCSTDDQYNMDGQNIASITGTYTDAQNPTLEATVIESGNTILSGFKPNTYCPVNFTTAAGHNKVSGKYVSTVRDHFFMTPKVREYADIVYAVPSADKKKFEVPTSSGSVNEHGFSGSVDVAWDYNAKGDVSENLETDKAYVFKAIVKCEVPASSASGTHRKSGGVPHKLVVETPVFAVYPSDISDVNPVTAVSDVNGEKAMAGVRYYNLQGMEHNQPWEGINIVVTTYSDGSRTTRKAMR